MKFVFSFAVECYLPVFFPQFAISDIISHPYTSLSLALSPSLTFSPSSVLSPGKRRYNIRLWKTFTDCFNCLPVAAILDEKIFCCHGGKLHVCFCLHVRTLYNRELLIALLSLKVSGRNGILPNLSLCRIVLSLGKLWANSQWHHNCRCCTVFPTHCAYLGC